MAVIDIYPTGPLNISKIKKMVWNPNKKNVISITYHIDGPNIDATNYIPCSYLDGNSITSIKLQGSMWINNSGDINGLTKGIPPLAIGTDGKEHLEIDHNEIAAKSDDITTSHLYLNMEGGNVSINSNCDKSIMFQDGSIYAKNSSYNNGNWINIVDGLNKNGDSTFGFGGYSNEIGSTNIYGNKIRLQSNNEISFECSNLILNDQEVVLSDSGWKTPSLASSMQNFGSNSNHAVKYRKVGKVVDIAGAVSPKATDILADGRGVILFTLPDGFRPAYTRTFMGQGSDRNVFLIQVNSTGGVAISRYRNTTSTTDTYPTSVPTTAWLPISVTFTVD